MVTAHPARPGRGAQGQGPPWPSAPPSGRLLSPQGYEDWLRHKADNAMNQCPVHFIQHGKLVRKQSRKLRVSRGHVLDPAREQRAPRGLC